MAKNVYHVITDLHDSDKKKNNRIDYSAEIDFVKDKILEICLKYKQMGFQNYIILLGDVFDRGYSNPDASTLANNFWVALGKKVAGIYTLVGNHELSFYKHNPFFTLLSSTDSPKLDGSVKRLHSPKGVLQVFNVVDKLTDGNTVFHFNHYGTTLSFPEEGKVNIALYHQDLVCKEILDEMRTNYNADIFEAFRPQDFETLKVFRGIDYNFFGHMHKVYGRWELIDNETKQRSVLHYLASLGRPNVTEVNDSFLERDIPSITVEDGIFTGVSSNKFMLMDRAHCVIEQVVEENKEKYAKQKEICKERNYLPVADDPIQNLKERCNDNEALSQILLGLLHSDTDPVGVSIRREVGNFINGRFN